MSTERERVAAIVAIMDAARAAWMDSAVPGLRDPFPVFSRPYAEKILALRSEPEGRENSEQSLGTCRITEEP